MALLWIEGFEGWGNVGATELLEIAQARYYQAVMVAPVLITGSHGLGVALQCQDRDDSITMVVPPGTEWVVGFSFKAPSSVYWRGDSLVQFLAPDRDQCELKLEDDYSLSFHGHSEIGRTTAGVLSPGEWSYVEVRVTIAQHGHGSFEVRVNEAPVMSASGVDTHHSVYWDDVRFIRWGGTLGAFDDIYLLNGDPGLNTFLGVCKVDRGTPSADLLKQWIPSSGTCHHCLVDEQTVSTADYVSTQVEGSEDSYQVSGYPLMAGPFGMQMNAVVKNSTVGLRNLDMFIESGGSRQNTLMPILDEQIICPAVVSETNPATDGPWTVSDLSTAEFGVRLDGGS